MFTSRAEYRLILRQDNCDERLMPTAYRLEFLEKEIIEKRKIIWEIKENFIKDISKMKIDPKKWKYKNVELNIPIKAMEFLKRPEINLDQIIECLGIDFEDDICLKTTIESDIKYSGFIEKQKIEINRLKKIEEKEIPENFEYNNVKGLLTESKNKLMKIRPRSLGQASRIPGVTPADITILAINIQRTATNIVSRETTGSDV
jgi:tRNA uridine 5-carboxymethylaminomethyl modification enzyme